MVSFYFPAKAMGSSMSLKQAYKMSDGFAIKIIMSTILAILPTLVMGIGFYLFAHAGLMMLAQEIKPLYYGAGMVLLGLLFMLWLFVKLYYIPLIFVIGVTVLSNYYQYVMRNSQSLYDQSASR